jgi:hypothetical protein
MLNALELNGGFSGARTMMCGAVARGIAAVPRIAVSTVPTCREEP